MKLTFIGANHEVTGSCHCLEACGKKILVDYGMEQGGNVYENAELPFAIPDVDYILITHAHIDHTGLLPLLYAEGFRGQIFATQATCDLCNIMLKDSAHIQEMEAEWKNRKARRAGKPEVEPLYTINDAQGVLTHFVPCHYTAVLGLPMSDIYWGLPPSRYGWRKRGWRRRSCSPATSETRISR